MNRIAKNSARSNLSLSRNSLEADQSQAGFEFSRAPPPRDASQQPLASAVLQAWPRTPLTTLRNSLTRFYFSAHLTHAACACNATCQHILEAIVVAVVVVFPNHLCSLAIFAHCCWFLLQFLFHVSIRSSSSHLLCLLFSLNLVAVLLFCSKVSSLSVYRSVTSCFTSLVFLTSAVVCDIIQANRLIWLLHVVQFL